LLGAFACVVLWPVVVRGSFFQATFFFSPSIEQKGRRMNGKATHQRVSSQQMPTRKEEKMYLDGIHDAREDS